MEKECFARQRHDQHVTENIGIIYLKADHTHRWNGKAFLLDVMWSKKIHCGPGQEVSRGLRHVPHGQLEIKEDERIAAGLHNHYMLDLFLLTRSLSE